MKKIFNVGVMALAITAVLTGCSKNSGMSEAEVQQYQQEKKVAELRKAYSTASLRHLEPFLLTMPGDSTERQVLLPVPHPYQKLKSGIFPKICGVVLKTRKAGMRMKQKMISRTINLLLF